MLSPLPLTHGEIAKKPLFLVMGICQNYNPELTPSTIARMESRADSITPCL
jgi:hypothetical protein